MQIIILILALSVDVFIASFSCGISGIKIRLLPAICISAVCSGVLALSLSFGVIIDQCVNEKYTTILCFVGLFLIGFIKIMEYKIKRYLKRHNHLHKKICFRVKQVNLVLQIYTNPQTADTDHSEVMSISESIFFALAMSLDGLFGGIGAAFLKINVPVTIVINFVVGIVMILLGYDVGKKTAIRSEKDFGWLSGALFIFLAIQKLM